MSNLMRPLDPELASLYGAEPPRAAAAASARPRVSHEPEVLPAEEADPLLELQAIAERNQKNYRNRAELQEGFDTVENDVSNVLKTCWDFVTR